MDNKLVDIHTHNPSNGIITLSSYGVHPWCASEVALPLCDSMFEGVDAVGEIGLDYCCTTPKGTQQMVFEQQLKIAEKLNKIVVIHCVRAYNEVLATLRKYTLRRVIFHGFIGSVQLSRQLLDCGYYLSFGERTFLSPKSLDALRAIPLNRLFLESDKSEVDIRQTYDRVAEILGCSTEDLSAEIYRNYKQIVE